MEYINQKNEIMEWVSELPEWKKAVNRLSRKRLNEFKKRFSNFIFIDKIYEYLITTKSNHTINRIEKKIDEFYDLYILEKIINKHHIDIEYRNKIGKLSLDKMKKEMFITGEAYEIYSEDSFITSMNGRKLSNYLRKDLGLLYYNKDYITREMLRKIVINDYSEGSFKTEFTLKYLIKALVMKVMPRSQKTGFVNVRTKKERYNYNTYLSLDWGHLEKITSMEYKKTKELSEILCVKLKEYFTDEIKYIHIGIASIYITTFSKQDVDKINRMLKDNLIINSAEITHEKFLKKPTRRKLNPIVI